MDTAATVPEMVLTRLAPARACWASVRLAWAVSTDAWSTATCWGVAFFVAWTPWPDVALDAEAVEAVGAEAEPVEPVVEADEVDLPAAEDEPAVAESDWRAEVRAFSSWVTCLMSADTWLWADDAWFRASVQVLGAPPPLEGVVVEVVEPDGAAQRVVACWSAAVAAVESESNWLWLATSVAGVGRSVGRSTGCSTKCWRIRKPQWWWPWWSP